LDSSNELLLLDVDGVLMTPSDWFGLKIRREAPEVAASFFDGPFLAATRGEIDLLDHLSPLIDALGRPCAPQEFLAEWHEYENTPNRPLWDAVMGIRHRFGGIYLATNQERHRTAHLLTKGGLASLVDGEFASCSIGHRKPTPEYFAEVTRRLGSMPERITFFDDAEENVAAARKAGWTAHVYRDVSGFLHDLAI
jgi:putative hydrolase of the HAD superfamily